MSSSRASSLSALLVAALAFIGQPTEAGLPTTTHAFEVVDGGTARIFFVQRERQVPLRLLNDGFLTWLPEKNFKVTYHLSSITGEPVGAGFRTRLPATVEPGEAISIELRVKDHPPPGIYRMQLDMVEEEVIWFSEKDRTPEPVRWIVVLPPVEFFLTLLFPCLVALGALLLRRRARRPDFPTGLLPVAERADLLWVATSLFGKPFLLYAELPRRFLPEITWSNSCAIAFPLLVLLLLAPRWRAIGAWLVAALAAFLVWGQTLYMRFFGDVATSAAVLASRQTGEIGESISFLSNAADWWLVADLVLALPLILTYRKSGETTSRRLLPAIGLLLAATPLLIGLANISDFTRGRNLRTLRDIKQFGLYGYQMLDTVAVAARRVLVRPPDDEELDRLANWFARTAPTRAAVGSAAGRARSYNLLAIQAESMQQFVVDYDVGGVPVMPGLRALSESATVFTAVQDQTSRGRSSAGDYIVNTSVLPIAESVAYQYPGNAHRTLAHALGDLGYSTLSAIPYKRRFWNRHHTHPGYGFETNQFVEDFDPGQDVGWGLNDVDFLRQMAPRLERLEQPFFAWLTTLSVHHPYSKFPEELKELDMGELEGTALGNYLHGMHLLDQALARLFERLQRSGLLDSTVVVLWGDHSSGLLREEEWVEFFGLGNRGHRRFQFRRVPFMIWVPGAPELAGRVDKPAGQLDIAPTLLALLGGEPDREPFIGRNLLGEPGAGPVVHPQASWISDDLVYLNPREDVKTVRCRDRRTHRPMPAEACRELNPAARKQIELSEMILEFDLQEEMRKRLRR